MELQWINLGHRWSKTVGNPRAKLFRSWIAPGPWSSSLGPMAWHADAQTHTGMTCTNMQTASSCQHTNRQYNRDHMWNWNDPWIRSSMNIQYWCCVTVHHWKHHVFSTAIGCPGRSRVNCPWLITLRKMDGFIPSCHAPIVPCFVVLGSINRLGLFHLPRCVLPRIFLQPLSQLRVTVASAGRSHQPSWQTKVHHLPAWRRRQRGGWRGWLCHDWFMIVPWLCLVNDGWFIMSSHGGRELTMRHLALLMVSPCHLRIRCVHISSISTYK